MYSKWDEFTFKMALKCTKFKCNVVWIDTLLTSTLWWRTQHRLYKIIYIFSQSNGLLQSKLNNIEYNWTPEASFLRSAHISWPHSVTGNRGEVTIKFLYPTPMKLGSQLKSCLIFLCPFLLFIHFWVNRFFLISKKGIFSKIILCIFYGESWLQFFILKVRSLNNLQ